MRVTRQLRSIRTIGLLLAAVALCPLTRIAPAAEPTPITEQNVITGTMDIDFMTRTTPDRSGDLQDGSPALGVRDKYTFDLAVAKTTQFSGTIYRQPNLYSKTLRMRKQNAALTFDVNLAVLNPQDLKQKKNVGKWVGQVPIDSESGAFELTGGRASESPLRIAIDSVGAAQGFTDNFGGRLVGKAEKKDNLAAYTYKRLVGSRTVQITVKRSDPMRFENIRLAKGPAEAYPATIVSGRLDYDYETGNWFTDGIRMRYTIEGKEYEDVITGSIKWVEDPNRATNGKGQYEFNLRFNEEKSRTPASESDAFKALSAEDAFFVVDDTIPCLTGTIAYVDTMAAGGDAPASSKVTYNLHANKLTKQQIMNFFKLWLLGIGPTNDE